VTATAPRPSLSIVIPLLNEAENLEALHARLGEVAATLDRPVELVFVDDGSTDDSFKVLLALRAKDPRVHVVRFTRNFGSHSAVLAGFRFATSTHVTVLAADLQDPPELLRELVRAADQGSDIVWASRTKRDEPWLGLQFSKLYNRLMRWMALPNWPREGFDFVVASRRVLDVVLAHDERNTSIFARILWTGFPQTSVPFERSARRAGRSKWTFAKKVKLAIDSAVSFSFLPIRFMSILGLVFASLGGLYAAITVARRIFLGNPVEGWASLMVVTLVLGGVQLMMLGIVGEYLWRALDEARGRPSFVVAESIGFEPPAPPAPPP